MRLGKDIVMQIKKYLPNPTYWGPITLFLGLLGSALLYIHTPVLPLVGEEVVKLTEDRVLLVLPASTKYCELKFKDAVNIKRYSITPVSREEGISTSKSYIAEIKRYTNIIRIVPSSVVEKNIINRVDSLRIDLMLSKQQPPAEIVGSKLDGNIINIDKFHKNYIRSGSSILVTTNTVRTDISQALVKYNELISNYLLSFMTAGAGFLLLSLIKEMIDTYFIPDEFFIRKIRKVYFKEAELNEDNLEDAKHKCGYQYARVSRYSKLF